MLGWESISKRDRENKIKRRMDNENTFIICRLIVRSA